MVSKVFIDANVILDFALQRGGYEHSRTIIGWAEQKKTIAHISPTVVQICAYWLAKSYGIKKAKEILAMLLTFVTTIDTPHEQVLAAIHSSMSDVEDALLYYTALHHQLDFIISNDRGFQKAALPSLPVISPNDFIEMLRN